MAYKQSPRSPLAKQLKGNQHKLPQVLQDAIKAAPESPAKQTNEFGEKGQFNPYTERGKKYGGQRRTHPRNAGRTKYAKDYQNKWMPNKSKDRGKGIGSTIGDQEYEMRATHKRDNVMGLRAEAYKARENNFGVKKPKPNVK